MDDVPAVPPGDARGDAPGGRAANLTALRERAMAGEISVSEYHAACYKVVSGYAYRNSRAYLDRDAYDAQDIVQETMTKAVQRYGTFIDRHVEDPGNTVGNVNGVLLAIARNLLADHNPRMAEPAPGPEPAPGRPGERPPRRQQSGEAGKRPVPFDDVWHQGDFGQGFAAPQSRAYRDEAVLAQARQQARRQLHKLIERARSPRACPFHMTSKAGCPYGGQVLSLIGELINRDIEREEPAVSERLRDLGRQLGLSSKDNEVRRQLTGCFDWWSYQAFRGTVIDQPRGGGDRIRMPLIGWLIAGKKAEGAWDSSACPKRGAQMILATDPEEFERLLAQFGRADVYEFLMRKAG